MTRRLYRLMIAQTTVVSKPLFPPLVHDDTTRVAICVVGIVVCLYVLYRVMRYFDSH